MRFQVPQPRIEPVPLARDRRVHCWIAGQVLVSTPWSQRLLLLFSRPVVSNSCQPHRLGHTSPPCLTPTPRAYPNSWPLSRWFHPTISSSVIPFSSRLQSFPSSGSFLMSRFFVSGGQSIGVSALASVLPMNIQDWSPLGWTAGSPCSPSDSK